MPVGSYECQDENKINIIHSTLPTWQTQLKIFRLVNINVLSYKLHSKGWKWEASVAKEKVLRKPAMQASWVPRILWALLALWLAIPQALFLTEPRCLSPRHHLLSSPSASCSRRIDSHAAWLWHILRHGLLPITAQPFYSLWGAKHYFTYDNFYRRATFIIKYYCHKLLWQKCHNFLLSWLYKCIYAYIHVYIFIFMSYKKLGHIFTNHNASWGKAQNGFWESQKTSIPRNFFLFLNFILYVVSICWHVYMCTICMQYLQGPEDGIRSSWNWSYR